MDENTIFQSPSGSQNPPESQKQEALVGNPVTPPPPDDLPSAPPPSKLFKILKILLGVVAVLIVIFLVFNFVLPKIFPGSSLAKVTLTYWGFEDQAVFQPVISEFEKNNPNIEITYVKQDRKQYRERVVTRSSNGNGPDVFKFHNSWVPMLSDLLLPLPESVITKEEFAKIYYPVASSDLIKNGVIYGVPLEVDTLNLYINSDLFKAAGLNPPTTWIEFRDDARQLTVKDENNNIKTSGVAMGTFDNITHAPDIISMLFAQNGVNLKNISSSPQEVSDALNFYTSFALPQANVWNDTFDESVKVFASGSLAMYFGYSSDFFTIKSINPNLSFNIYPVPNLPGQKATVASYWAEGASSKSEHQKEALLFLKYLAQKETQQKLFTEESKIRNFGKPYARVDLADKLNNSAIYPFVSSAQFAVSSFFVDGTYDNGLNSQMNNHLNTAVDSILRGSSPQSATETLS
ncbi:MAG: sugar ABC transporter substrate-binding protein, partial [Candidatus Levybacteria bacterium]|nr:sugar ABC transporter substrate-binding protein [Candidatus Levybacteria bacterium]